MAQNVSVPDRGLVHLADRRRYGPLSSLAIVVAISALALGLRLAAIGIIGPDARIASYSESGIVAKNLVDGQGYTYDFYGLRTDQPLRSFMPPLYVGLIYACLRWAHNPPLALALVYAVLSSLICGAIYVIALVLSRKRSAAVLAALAAACYPVLILMVTGPESLILHSAVLLWAVAVSLMLPGRLHWGLAVLAGILWGLIALGRPALLGFLPLLVWWLWLNRRDRSGWLRTSLVLVVMVILVLLPWVVRNYRIFGQVVISTNGGATFWNGNNPFTTGSGHDVYSERLDQFLGQPHDPEQPAIIQVYPYPMPADIQAEVATVSELTLERELYRAGLDFIHEHPRQWVVLVSQKLISFWWFRPRLGSAYEASWTPYYKLTYVLLIALFIPGLAVSLKHRRRYSLLYLLFGYYTVTNVAFQVLTRYRWEIEPLFLVFATLFLSIVAERMYSAWRCPPGARLKASP
jgi:hypothetical protein